MKNGAVIWTPAAACQPLQCSKHEVWTSKPQLDFRTKPGKECPIFPEQDGW